MRMCLVLLLYFVLWFLFWCLVFVMACGAVWLYSLAVGW